MTNEMREKSGLEIHWKDAGFIEELKPKNADKGASR
jgi:hypothetical protein